MNPLAYALLTDENINPEVAAWLSVEGHDVRTVFDERLAARPDVDVLRHANQQARAVVTHDADFGRLAIRAGEPFYGLIYLRPGHHEPAFVIETLLVLRSTPIAVEPPFIVVAERRGQETRIRVRQQKPW